MGDVLKENKGFTLIEIAIVVAIIATLSAIILPMAIKHLETAKVNRAKKDAATIGASILRFNSDTAHWPVYSSEPYKGDKATINILYCDGIAPALASGVANWWDDTWTDDIVDENVDKLQNHLERGMAGDVSYPRAGIHAWNGPYLADFKSDPWGSKYLVNVQFLRPNENKAVWVISAGSNRTIDTVYEQQISGASAAPAVGGDDIAFRVK